MVDTEANRDPEGLLAHAGWVRGLVRALVLDPGRADDVVQQTYLAALERPPRRMLDPRAWLGGVARNLIRDGRRRDARRDRRERDSARPEQLPSADDLVAKAELQRAVVKAVVELDEPYRSTLLLHFFEDLSAERIAERQGVPGSTVRNRLKRGLDRLRERFDREHHGDRRAWALAFAPLVRTGGLPVRPGPLPVPMAPVATAAATTGGSSMIAKIWIGMAAAAAVVVGGGTAAYVLRGEQGPAAAETPVQLAAPAEPTMPSASAPAAELASASEVRTAAPGGATASGLSGEVLDTDGAAVEGAEVFVAGWSDPFGGEASEVVLAGRDGRIQRHDRGELRRLPPDVLEREGLMVGRILRTDSRGRFHAALPTGARAHVRLVRAVGIRPAQEGAWHTAPASELVLSAVRIPTATVTFRVLDETTGRDLASFRGELFEQAGDEDHELDQRVLEGENGAAAVRLELERRPATYHVKIVQPPWAESEQEFVVAGGQDREVVLTTASGSGFSGEVTDTFGRPVEGALVFWGEPSRMRQGGNTGRPFDPSLVPDAVTSDAAGRFRLPGEAETLSAWHAKLSPASVQTGEDTTLVLPPRGALFGKVFDEHGEPAAGKEVRLDRERSTVVAPDGSWRLEGIEAGAHGLSLPGERWGTAVVTAGGQTEVAPRWLGDVEVQVLAGGSPFGEGFSGVVVGSDPSYYLIREFRSVEGVLTLQRAIPDRYWVISRSGRIASFEVDGTKAVLELGDADLTVHAPPGGFVYALPEEAPEPVTYWARRIGVVVGDAGTATFSPLPRGTWRVGTHEAGILTTVEVEGPGTELKLPE